MCTEYNGTWYPMTRGGGGYERAHIARCPLQSKKAHTVCVDSHQNKSRLMPGEWQDNNIIPELSMIQVAIYSDIIIHIHSFKLCMQFFFVRYKCDVRLLAYLCDWFIDCHSLCYLVNDTDYNLFLSAWYVLVYGKRAQKKRYENGENGQHFSL